MFERDLISTETLTSETKRYKNETTRYARAARIPAPEIMEIAEERFLYRKRSGRLEVLGKVADGPYENSEGKLEVSYVSLEKTGEKLVKTYLKQELGIDYGR